MISVKSTDTALVSKACYSQKNKSIRIWNASTERSITGFHRMTEAKMDNPCVLLTRRTVSLLHSVYWTFHVVPFFLPLPLTMQYKCNYRSSVRYQRLTTDCKHPLLVHNVQFSLQSDIANTHYMKSVYETQNILKRKKKC